MPELSSLSPFIQSRMEPMGWHCPQWVDILMSVNLINIIPHRSVQQTLCQMILGLIRLTAELNHFGNEVKKNCYCPTEAH